jgi:hypothetical protein
MGIGTVRRPGEKGTQALMQKYGERLVCIRYRYDPARKKRLKTVELIVAEQDWQPPEPHPQELKATGLGPKCYRTGRLGLRLGFEETGLRKQIKAAGGLWDPAQKLWFVPEEEVRRLGLLERVVKR